MIQEYLRLQLESEFTALPNFRVILLNATGSIASGTDAATILNWEAIQRTGGYQSFAFPAPASGSAIWNGTDSRAELLPITATFTEAAGQPGYTATHAALWQGRGAISNRPIGSINPSNNQITCPTHGLINGDRAFVRSDGTLPGGLAIQRYWVEAIDGNTVILHTNSGLSAPADITTTGAGQLYLQHANGRLARAPFLLPGGSVLFEAGVTRGIQVKPQSAIGGL